jgi:hypothetical protein
MDATLQQSFTERFSEPNTPYLSPARIGEFFGYQIQELAEHARVHFSTPTLRPQAPQLQKYLQDLVRVLAVATSMTKDEKRAAFLLCNEPLRSFDHKTANVLIREGRTENVIAYLKSFASGSAG